MGTWATTTTSPASFPAASARPSQKARDLADVALAFVMIESALWTTGVVQRVLMVATALTIYALSRDGRWTLDEMGWRGLRGETSQTLVAAGALLAAAIVAASWWAGTLHGALTATDALRCSGYGVWSMVQEFIVLGFMFTRFAAWLGDRRAVWYSAALFGIAHLPNPVLTPVTFAGGLVLAEIYRRTRNFVPLGIVHWLIGTAIAASAPETWVHRMRVGIGYLLYQAQ